MKKIYFRWLCLVTSIILLSCHKGDKTSYPTSGELEVKWELITNQYQGKNQCLLAFTITNKSKYTFNERGWEMFFSQMPPIPIIERGSSARVEHINGDWFKLVPSKNFNLAPGKQIKIEYIGTGFMIKKTDAALGVYFVFYDENGHEKAIVPIKNIVTGDFTKSEQLTRTKDDVTIVPTPLSRFQDNLNATVLPVSSQNKIVPSPVFIKDFGSNIRITHEHLIFFEEGLKSEASFLADRLNNLTGNNYQIHPAKSENGISISLKYDRSSGPKKPESYTLDINPDKKVVITGSDEAGVFYGIQSLINLIPIKLFSKAESSFEVPVLTMNDSPRFSYRGLHFDMSRNFQTKERIMKMLDLMAFYKLNYFLFYFMEDEGWRVEIPGLPELTQIGGVRQHCKVSDPALHPSYGSGPFANSQDSYGSGFFTSEEFVEMLRYAKERHIKVIPCINFPAHVRSAIKAMEYRYQKLMKEGKETEANEFRLIDPDDQSIYVSAQGYHDNVVCIGRESIYHFYETAVIGIRQMYDLAGMKMDYFHTGGDEVATGAWSGSPMVNKMLAENPELSNNDKSLQAYCFRRISEVLKKQNVTNIGGWEEAALIQDPTGKTVPNMEFVGKNFIPYLWNNLEGSEDLGYRLANAGYQVVLCDVSNFYLDFPYNKDPEEPGNYWAGFLETKNFYAFAPYNLFLTTTKTPMGLKIDFTKEYSNKVRLLPEAKKNILGVQAQIWSETIKGGDMLEYYYLPRLIAFSETAWAAERSWESIEDQKERELKIDTEWNVIANTLACKELPRLSFLKGGYNYRVPLPGCKIENGLLYANTEFPGLEIRYTTDGSEPTATSALYSKPVKVSGVIKAKSFVKGGKNSRTSVIQ